MTRLESLFDLIIEHVDECRGKNRIIDLLKLRINPESKGCELRESQDSLWNIVNIIDKDPKTPVETRQKIWERLLSVPQPFARKAVAYNKLGKILADHKQDYAAALEQYENAVRAAKTELKFNPDNTEAKQNLQEYTANADYAKEKLAKL